MQQLAGEIPCLRLHVLSRAVTFRGGSYMGDLMVYWTELAHAA